MALENQDLFLVQKANKDKKKVTFAVLKSAIEAGDGPGPGGVTSVNGEVGDVVLDAADVNALPDTYTPPVTSVNSKTGAITLTASDVGALPDSYTPPAAPVTSVNSKTGAVVLTASDINALPDTTPVGELNVQADWDEDNSLSDAFIKNKPTFPGDTNTTYELLKDVYYNHTTGKPFGGRFTLKGSDAYQESFYIIGSGSVDVVYAPDNGVAIETNLQKVTDGGNTTDNKINAAGYRIDQLTTITASSP